MIDIKKPIQIKIELNERKDGLCDFFYSETVKEEDKAIFEKTVKFLSKIPDAPIPEISNDGKTFTIRREGIEREEAFDMIAGEFIANCNFGEITIAELFIFAGMALQAPGGRKRLGWKKK